MDNLKSVSLKRSIYFALSIGSLLLAVLLRLFGHEFDLQFLIKFFTLSALMSPIIFLIGFTYLLFYYRCPSCYAWWSYEEVGNYLMNGISKYYKMPYTNFNILYKVEERVIERKCKCCNNSQTRKKLKRILEKE